ncbi:MAG: DNA-processing protein DprA [Hominilimicola sp.]
MEHVLYWLWLTTKFAAGDSKITKLLERFDSIEDIYFSKNFNNIYGISEKDKPRLMDKDLSKAKVIMERTALKGGKIIVYDDENYPQILKNISNPPYVLYILGKVPELDKVLTIGVVGTRVSSQHGDEVTENLCRNLAQSGVVTISGLAVGIDAVGAWATIDAGGIAVGVIASGIDGIYPHENAELYKAVKEKGCIMTEYPPGTPPFRTNFPVRNRIIAGLSRGVLVTEAPKKSGSLITARCALENNRDVFAVPRRITDTEYLGTNILIQQGAKLVNTADDILAEYPYAVKIKPKRKNAQKPPRVVKAEKKKEDKAIKEHKTTKENKEIKEKYSNLNKKDKSIIELLRIKDMQIDEMSRKLGISVGELNTRLIMLECNGLIKRLPASTYHLNV